MEYDKSERGEPSERKFLAAVGCTRGAAVIKKMSFGVILAKIAVLVNIVNVIPLFPGCAYLKCKAQNKYDTPSKLPFWFTMFTAFSMVKVFTIFCLNMRHLSLI